MSDFCPHCDDFSIDASRAKKKSIIKPKKKPEKKPKLTINVDNSNLNADWIKKVRDE